MTYPPTPGPDGTYPPPPDPPVQAYQPPQPYDPQQFGYGTPPAQSYDYGSPPVQAYGAHGYGTSPVQGYGAPPTPGYDYGYPGSPYATPWGPPRSTEGMAIASLVISCAGVLGLCFWTVGGLLGILGAIFGHIARRRIRTSGAGGDGLALAGIIIGWIVTGIAVLGAAALIAFIATDNSTA